MPRYIDADEALLELEKELVSDEFNYAVRAISRVKTAEVVERKKGQWEESTVFEAPSLNQYQSARCSVCGLYHTTPYSYYFYRYKYCPYCGAEMSEDKADD